MADPRRLQRLLELKDKDWKRRLAESARLERELGEMVARERELLSLLCDNGLSATLFADLTLNQLQAAGRRRHEMERLRDEKLAEAKAAGQGVKALERFTDKVTEKVERDAEAVKLQAAIQLSLHPSRVRLP